MTAVLGEGIEHEAHQAVPVLRVTEVTKTYVTGGGARRDALRGVSLDVAAGSFTSIMGPSGSGKSTLLHLLGALIAPTSGRVELDGRDLGTLDDRALAEVRRHRVGFVFQAFNLVPVLSAIENVALPAAIAGLPTGAATRRAAELLELVDLSAQAQQRPAELSGGEQQRVAIARALLMRPSVLLADEPTGNLDSATGAQVLGVLRRAHVELGQATIVVTHDARVAAAGDEVALIADGLLDRRLRLDGSRSNGRSADQRERTVLRWLQTPRDAAVGR